MRQAPLVALLMLACILPARADEPAYTRFLVPFISPDSQGAFGSVWHVETWLHYAGTVEATIVPVPFCYAPLCTEGGQLPAGYSALPVFARSGLESTGILFHVESTHASEVTFTSRIRDLARQAESAGTEVPVVREDRITHEPLYLLNVPRASKFRTLLRIYALPEVQDPEVEVRYYPLPDVNTGEGLSEYVVPLRVDRLRLQSFTAPVGLQLRPSAGHIPNLESLPELAEWDAIWIEVVPVTPGARLWAFVSVTNNDTQQVTLISPIGR
jgi:hypothetical protein